MTPFVLISAALLAAAGSPALTKLHPAVDDTRLQIARPGQKAKPHADTPLHTAPPVKREKFAARKGAPIWSTAAGHAALTSRMLLGPVDGKLAASLKNTKPMSPVGPAMGGCEAVTITENPDCGCASYLQPDQIAGKSVWYLQPLHAFGDEQSARNFAITVTPKVPLVYPFHDPSVHAGQGWLYGDRSFHGAVDYSKSGDQYGPGKDPTFAVHASGDGVVVAVFWDSWSGNIVTIEHTAPDGSKIRTNYFHLRNGHDHDVAQALKTDPGTDPSGKPARYLKYAKLASKYPLLWGTNAQTIMVKAGDKVVRGQQIAWSGSTGPGGAGAGLNLDGTPTDPNTGNNHLHMMAAVPRPNGDGNWVQVDMFGVYNTLDNASGTDCYDLGQNPAYARLMAPFPPSFDNLPADTFLKYWSYYTGMGMVLQTFSVHRHGGDVLTSGSFQWGIENDWYVYFYLHANDAQAKFDDFLKKGYRPREISVTLDDSKQPRINMIWKKMHGESFYSWTNLSDADWMAKWNDLVKKQGFRVEDHFEWSNDGKPHHAAIFVKDGQSDFVELHNLSSPGFQTDFDKYFKQGYQLQDINAAEGAGARTYGGIWMKKPGYWMTYYDQTPAQYQSNFWTLQLQGYRLWKIQGYADSGLFAAIWTK